MSHATRVKVGSVVQLHPENAGNPAFRGCLMIVTDLKGWGVCGYVQALGTREAPGGQAHYRAKWDEFEHVGEAAWALDFSEGEPDESR